jgi:hypothetical protein
VRSKASCTVASPKEPYHSITWGDVSNIRKYIKEQGYNPDRLGYSSEAGEIAQKILLASTIIGGAVMTINYLAEKCSNTNGMPQIIPIGRGANLPKGQQKIGTRNCTTFGYPGQIHVSYQGELQYCIYTCHDGFMNINELSGIDKKEDAVKLIIERLSKDITFRDMAKYERCYFSKKIRKKQVQD